MQSSLKFVWNNYGGLIRLQAGKCSNPRSAQNVSFSSHVKWQTCKHCKICKTLLSDQLWNKTIPSTFVPQRTVFSDVSYIHHPDDDDIYYRKRNRVKLLAMNQHCLKLVVPPLFSISVRHYAPERQTKVEETVKVLKTEPGKPKADIIAKPVVKKPLGQRILHELKHYYHGFRLLFLNIKISSKLAFRLLRGKGLSRREHKLFIRTVSDMFRLIPFMVIILVPFLEFALPFILMLFPGILPSTFQTSSDKELKAKKQLRLKLEMAKFLQDTLDQMTVQSSGDKSSQSAKEFRSFFEKVRTSGRQVNNEEILKFSKLFEDELTLDNLSRPQLVALCHLLELQPFGTTKFLNFELRMRLRKLKADDKVIKKEGIENMTLVELQSACKARGMRSVGINETRLRSQLMQWLDLSLKENIPPSLLLLTRALYLSEEVPAAEQIAATISKLPEAIAIGTQAKIGELEGKVDNKVRLQLIKEEEKAIKAEKEEDKIEAKEESKEELKTLVGKEVLVDKAPLLQVPSPAERESKVTANDLGDIESAIETIAVEKKQLLLEKEELADLKAGITEYKEDVQELKDVVKEAGLTDKHLRESKAASRLSKQVSRLVSKVDGTIEKMEEIAAVEKKTAMKPADPVVAGQEMVSIEEVLETLKKMNKTDHKRLQKITSKILKDLDADNDGFLKVDDIVNVFEILSKEKQNIPREYLKEIIETVEKEENIQMVEKIEKVMDQKKSKPKPEQLSRGAVASLQPPKTPS